MGGLVDQPAVAETGTAIPFILLALTAFGGDRSSPGAGLMFVQLLVADLRVSGGTGVTVGFGVVCPEEQVNK